MAIPSLRYEVRVRFGHPNWNGRLVNLNRYRYASKDEAIMQVEQLAKSCAVTTEAFVIHDSAVNVGYVFTREKEYIALDRLPSVRRLGGNNEAKSAGNQKDHS